MVFQLIWFTCFQGTCFCRQSKDMATAMLRRSASTCRRAPISAYLFVDLLNKILQVHLLHAYLQEALRRGLTELLPKPPPQARLIASHMDACVLWGRLVGCPFVRTTSDFCCVKAGCCDCLQRRVAMVGQLPRRLDMFSFSPTCILARLQAGEI